MKRFKFRRAVCAALSMVMVITGLAGCGSPSDDAVAYLPPEDFTEVEEVKQGVEKEEPVKTEDTKQTEVRLSERPSLLSSYGELSYQEFTPKLAPYSVDADLSNVINADQFYLDNEEMAGKLSENLFVVQPWGDSEFFEVYEPNRYDYIPNFITVDAMLHTYHLYFSYLLKRTEKQELSPIIEELSKKLLSGAKEQYEALSGSEWEEAAKVNLAFFAVPNLIYRNQVDIPEDIKKLAQQELSYIEDAGSIDFSPIFDFQEDYTQYKPRGYYEGDEQLEKYFKAMTWYGRIGFTQDSELYDRSALLQTLLIDGEVSDWETVYEVTSFFAGTSDDNGYYEYLPIVETVYGKNAGAAELLSDPAAFDTYHELTGKLPAPQINSVPVEMSDTDEEVEAANTGFRFMGQRFTIDESIFSRLVYRKVEENSLGELRMLPDALDVPAALGSELAEKLLEDDGNMDFKNYRQNLEELKASLAAAPESSWNVSLYSGWVNTLRPLLKSRGEGYPSFMQSEAWEKKDLITFLGSYTELKHDTILYGKQLMAEMGGGGEEPEERDDRGYVEPEPEVFARLAALVGATKEGLTAMELLDRDSSEDLGLLQELSEKLQVMSEKELRGELLTDEEYELIRDFGGQIEHFWQVANRDQADGEYFSSYEFPAPVVADIATDPNGTCLEVGTGDVKRMLVIIEVDGKLKIAVGAMFSFYEFPWPIDKRLTDSQWRRILGTEWDETGEWSEYRDQISEPVWTESLKYTPDYNY
ncbi:MAG: DUF3160 domain-containing protein [Lachnospiraceae bacterium]|nr:DUF3160 domain-containing protein [Lachnospiraceae bacterium]